jgi:cellulose synthase/poly-beta-1,6-N-acetylglucosamine synthase-like glycosyltransferase
MTEWLSGWTLEPWAMEAIHTFSIVVLIYFSALQLVLFGLLIVSFFDMRRRLAQNFYADYEAVAKSHFTFPISVLMPAYNESASVIDSVRSVISLDYPQHEVIVVNDGSTDDTLPKLIHEFRLERREFVYRRSLPTFGSIRGIYRSPIAPNLIVVDKEHTGKSDTLNVGLNFSRYPLFCTIDADSLFQENALLRVVRPFLEDPDRVIAVGGQVRVANGCRVERGRVVEPRLPTNILAAFQVVEYLRAFVASRLGLSAMNNLLILSGVFSLFRKEAVLEVGGYREGVITEDMELVLRLHRHMREQRRPYAVVFLPDPICWTEVPERVGTLARQRSRWHRGLIHSLWLHRSLLWGRHTGSLRWVGYPYYFLFEFMGPIIELLGYVVIPIAYFLGFLSPIYFWAFLFLAITSGTFLSVSAVFLEELSFGLYRSWGDFAQMVGIGVLENFSYRILTLFFRLKGLLDILFRRNDWGRQDRAGFGRPTAPASVRG